MMLVDAAAAAASVGSTLDEADPLAPPCFPPAPPPPVLAPNVSAVPAARWSRCPCVFSQLAHLQLLPQALPAWQGDGGGVLYSARRSDGKELSRLKLPSPPVFDGLAVAGGQLYLSLKNGSVLQLHERK